MKKHKIRVIQDGNRFYPQCKVKRFFEYFFTEGGQKVYFNSVQNSLEYMSERLYRPNKSRIVYKGNL